MTNTDWLSEHLPDTLEELLVLLHELILSY
jgi:hypothetical protein